MTAQKTESWNSRLGVILAVSGSAVGLGNFLRFPGQAAEYGGGAFMIAYFISFVLVGLTICWAEWTMGRAGGQHGFHSTPGILHAIVQRPYAKYVGAIGIVIPVIIYMYYVVIEAWCLGYAVNFIANPDFQLDDPEAASAFFVAFTGAASDGAAWGFGIDQVGIYIIAVFILNFILIYRGIARGIELFCTYAMPTLVVLAIIILIRVLTLGAPDPAHPENNVSNGLGFMWNPTKVLLEEQVIAEDGTESWAMVSELVGPRALESAQAEVASHEGTMRVVEVGVFQQLANPELWLAAAGQIFFSLSVGFGIILTYASYLRRKDDVVLSGLAASSANEFAEVGLGGLITLPAAVAFIGVSGLAATGMSTFGLGFNVLPQVFAQMPLGTLFGFFFFFLLFLAAVTSSLSMLQPGIAFLENAMSLNRKQSVAILGMITAMGCMFVVTFSGDLKALDTLDFWVGTFLIFILATIQIITFGWIMGVEKGFASAHEGATIRIPRFFGFIIKYVSPVYLVAIFALWVLVNVFGVNLTGSGEAQLSYYITDLIGNKATGEPPNLVAWLSVSVIIMLATFTLLILNSSPTYREFLKRVRAENGKDIS